MSPAPRHKTRAVHSATTTATTGERSDLTRRALSAAFTVARLASPSRDASTSCAPNVCTVRIDSRPVWSTDTMSLSRRRTSRVAFLTARLNRVTNSSRNGVIATTSSVKSQLSQNIRPSIPTMVMKSTRMLSVSDDTKSCTVETSSVIVLRSNPV
jgi:hypothetical protein